MLSIRTASLLLAAIAAGCASRTTTTMASTPTEPAAAGAATNPLFAPSTLPYLAPHFDRIRDEHYLPAFERGMAEHMAEVEAIAASKDAPTFANTIEAMERSGQLLSRVSAVFFNLSGTDNNDTIQKIEAEVAPKLAKHSDSIYLDPRVFARVVAVYEARDQLQGEQKRLTERYHTAFVRAGAKLDDKAKARIKEINAEASSLTTEFSKKLLADTKALAVVVDTKEELAGLGDSGISAAADAAKAAGKEGKYLITLELPTSQGILSSLQNQQVRKRVFEAANSRCNRGNENDTSAITTRLAALRAEKAALMGYPSHAAYVLADQMAGSPEAVMKMLGSMAPKIAAKTKAEHAELQAHVDSVAPGMKVEAWDWSYVAEQVRKARYAFDEATVRQYFELNRVLDGMFFMAKELYGTKFVERKDLPVYHPDVRVYEVFNEDGSAVGLFYTDYYNRPSKRGGAWMNNFVEQSLLLGQKPVVVNVMNIQKPGEGQPTLLSFDEVTTLFHEFGHGVHGLFSDVRYPLIAGTNTPRDFVEFPSQFHEDFAFDPRVLEITAKHWQTGEPMPKELLDKVLTARKYGQGFASFEYVAAALLDMEWHMLSTDAKVTDVKGFEAEALRRNGMDFAMVPPRYRTTYFNHVWASGYSAGYYAYLWSEALAADGFDGVMASGGMNRANGQKYRDTVLSRGLTVEPMKMYEDFRGRPLDTDAVLKRRGLL